MEIMNGMVAMEKTLRDVEQEQRKIDQNDSNDSSSSQDQ